MIFSRQKGQFMIESMIAIGVIVIGLLGILALLSNSLSLNRVVADQYVGVYLASEGTEVVKSIIDANVIAGAPFNQGIPLDNNPYEVQYDSSNLTPAGNGHFLWYNNGAYTYGGLGKKTDFKRIIRLTQGDTPDEIDVKSQVTWSTRGGGSFEVTINDKFYNWR